MKRREFFELWIKALQSGEYKQTRGTLVKNDKYCCLGVACSVAVEMGKKVNYYDFVYLPDSMTKFLGIDEVGRFNTTVKYRGKDYKDLAELNDDGIKFKTIARIIEEQLAAGNFRKPFHMDYP